MWELENGEEPLTHPRRSMRIGETTVEKYGLLQTIEVRRAVWTSLEVFPDCSAGAGAQLRVEFFLKVPCNLAARCSMSVNPLHDRRGAPVRRLIGVGTAAHRNRELLRSHLLKTNPAL